MAACYGLLKEPDNMCFFKTKTKKSRLKKFHSVIKCSGTVAREDKCKFF